MELLLGSLICFPLLLALSIILLAIEIAKLRRQIGSLEPMAKAALTDVIGTNFWLRVEQEGDDTDLNFE